MPRHIKPLAERFWLAVEKTDTCWLWRGRLYPNGYGQIGRGMRNGGHLLAHRVSYEFAFGLIPKGMQVCHHCDVRACVRPSHLFLGTQKDNIRDCIRKGRNSRPPLNTRYRGAGARFTDDEVRAIREAYRTGVMNQMRLADFYGVNQALISLIVNRRTYRNVV